MLGGLAYMVTRYSLDFFDSRYERYHKVSLKDVRQFIEKYYIGADYLASVVYNHEEAIKRNVDLNGDRFYDQHVAAHIESGEQ